MFVQSENCKKLGKFEKLPWFQHEKFIAEIEFRKSWENDKFTSPDNVFQFKNGLAPTLSHSFVSMLGNGKFNQENAYKYPSTDENKQREEKKNTGSHECQRKMSSASKQKEEATAEHTICNKMRIAYSMCTKFKAMCFPWIRCTHRERARERVCAIEASRERGWAEFSWIGDVSV